jgi:hypothetical protein
MQYTTLELLEGALSAASKIQEGSVNQKKTICSKYIFLKRTLKNVLNYI